MTVTEMIARQSEITTLARSENRDLTEDETREFNELQAKIDAAKPATPATGSPSPDLAGGDDAVQRAVAAERQRVAGPDLHRRYRQSRSCHQREGGRGCA